MSMALRNKRRELTKYIWGLILLPIITDKKEVIKHIENVKEIFEFYGFQQPEDRVSRTYDYWSNSWNQLKIEESFSFLKSQFFFSRFDDSDLLKYMEFIKLEKFDKNQVIFVDGDYVYVILIGQVLTYI